MALAAGSDIALWLTTDKVSAVLDALEKAVANGKLSMEHVDASVTRILRAKKMPRCSQDSPSEPKSAPSEPNPAPTEPRTYSPVSVR